MEQGNIKREIESFLQSGKQIEVAVRRPNILHKIGILRRVREFIIYPITLGTLLRISELLSDVDPEDFKGMLEIVEKGKDERAFRIGIESIKKYVWIIARVIAYAVTNSKNQPDKKIVRFLEKNLDVIEALKILNVIVQQMQVKDFLALMVSVSGLNLMGAGSISGESPEESSNITDSQERKSSGASVGQT